MHRYVFIFAGLLMMASGAYLIFGNPEFLPLWFVWTVGPLCWYLGMAATLTAVAIRLFAPAPKPAPRREEVPVLHFGRLGQMPARVIHEIPSMGAFIL